MFAWLASLIVELALESFLGRIEENMEFLLLGDDPGPLDDGDVGPFSSGFVASKFCVGVDRIRSSSALST